MLASQLRTGPRVSSKAAFGGPSRQSLVVKAVAAVQDDVVRVSGKSNSKLVAGKIAHTSRAGTSNVIHVLGPESTSVAVKSICVARQYLSQDPEPSDISFVPATRVLEGEEARSKSLVFTLTTVRTTGIVPPAVDELVEVGRDFDSDQSGKDVAALLSAGKVVGVQGMGPLRVAIGVACLAAAAAALPGKTVTVSPYFVKVKKEGEEEERTAVCMQAAAH